MTSCAQTPLHRVTLLTKENKKIYFTIPIDSFHLKTEGAQKEHQFPIQSGRKTSVMPNSSKFSAPNPTNPYTLYLKRVQSSVEWPGILA